MSELEQKRLWQLEDRDRKKKDAGISSIAHFLVYALVGYFGSEAFFWKFVIVDLIGEICLNRQERR